MKRVVALFLATLLLFGSLIPQNDLSELNRLPELVEHYQYHHTVAGGSLSLGQFMVLHYSPDTTHYQLVREGKHRIEHQKLPLHSHHNCIPVAFVLPVARLLVPTRVVRIRAPQRAAERPLYTFCFSAALLQPPRV